jgi:hypothetical protein
VISSSPQLRGAAASPLTSRSFQNYEKKVTSFLLLFQLLTESGNFPVPLVMRRGKVVVDGTEVLERKEIRCRHDFFDRKLYFFVMPFLLHCEAKIKFDGFLDAAGGNQGGGETGGTGFVAFVLVLV